MARVRTLRQAAAWIDRVGLALVFPKSDVVLPSLWEQVHGDPAPEWAERDADGAFVRWTPDLAFLWRAKDELPGKGLVCVGRHLARSVSCVRPALLPALAAAGAEVEPGPEELHVVAAVRENGPLTAPQLRSLLGLDKRTVERALAQLHRRVVLTHSHLVGDGAGWGSLAHELVERKWPSAVPPPARDEARQELARLVLGAAGELAAPDLAAIFGWRRRQTAAVLDEVAESRDGGGFRIWTRP